MIRPRDVPRLPVLDWQGFGLGGVRAVPSVIDGSEHVFTSSGRAAIMLGLECLGVGKGDQVMVPTYHCPTMVAPIIAVGAEPVFYPINERGEALLESACLETGAVKAVIAPHFFGIPQDMSSIRTFCDQRNIALIEDCAHCFFGLGGTRAVGHWGDIAIASLTKFFPVSAGGILAFPHGTLRKPHSPPPPRERNSRPSPIFWKQLQVQVASGASGRYCVGSSRLNVACVATLRAYKRLRRFYDAVLPEAFGFDIALAHRAPERICRWIPFITNRRRLAECRRANYRKLASALSGHQGFSPLFSMLPDGSVPYVFPLRVEQPDGKYHKLKGLGLPVFRWNWLWPGTPAIAGDSGLAWSSEVFQLACHQDLTDEELDCICSTIIRTCTTSGAGRL